MPRTIVIAATLVAGALVSAQERSGTAVILDEIRRTGSFVVDGIQFDGSGSLGADAGRRLEPVLHVLSDHTEWRFEVRVSSADEADAARVRVLQQRAEAVVAWFTRRGIDRDRLVAAERRRPDATGNDRRSEGIEFRKLNEE